MPAPVQELFASYQALSGEQRQVVDLLAVAYNPVPLEELDLALKELGATRSAKALSEPLIRARLIEVRQNFYESGYVAYHPGQGAALCARSIAERIARELARADRFKPLAQRLLDARKARRLFGWSPASEGDFLRSVRTAFYEGDYRRLDELYAGAGQQRHWTHRDDPAWVDRATALALICGNPFDREWLLRLPPADVDATLERLIGPRLNRWEAIDADLGRLLVEGCSGSLGRGVPPSWHYSLAYLDLLEGRFDAAATTLRILAHSGLDPCLALLREGLDACISSNDDALADLRKATGKKTAVFGGAIGSLPLVALWLRQGEGDARKAKALLASWQKQAAPGPLQRTLNLVPRLLDHDADALDSLAVTSAQAEHGWRADPLGFTLAYLLCAWFDRQTALDLAPLARDCADLATRRGMNWPAAELTAILARLQPGSGQAEVFERERRVVLLANRIPLLEPWERALAALVAIATPEPTAARAPGSAAETRLVWVVTERGPYDSPIDWSVEPREQKRTARGWSKGTRVGWEKLEKWSAEGNATLHEQDHQVARHIGLDRYRVSRTLGERGWLALVGHPHLLAADTFEPVELQAGQFELRVKKLRGDAVHITLEPDFMDDQQVAIWAEGPTRLRVAEVSDAHRRIRKALGDHGLTVPATGQDKVLAALGAVASLVTVHSDIGGATGGSEAVSPDPAPRVRLEPDGAGLAVKVLVRPFGEVGPYYPPGKGGRALFIEADGRRLHTERDLAAERLAADSLVAGCPSLAEALPDDDYAWSLPEPDLSLGFLLDLQGLPSPVGLEWPKGKPFLVAGKADFSKLKLQISSSKDWFGLDGQLEIGEDLVISMQQLLELLGQSRGRFVQLDDGRFLALTDAFRRRLGDLEALSERHGKVRRLSALAVPLLEELAAEAGAFEATGAWRRQVARLREAEAMQPEVPDGFQGQLRDYQVEGYRWLTRLAHWGVGACLADDMGLGKTLQALAVILARAPGGPSLVVAPTSVCANWQTESLRFAPALTFRELGPTDRKAAVDALGPMDVLVCGYALLQQPSVAELLASRTWRTIVLDEAQAIKNAATRRSQAAMDLQGEFKLITTGTPIENHLGELWNLFRFLTPGLLGSLEGFNRRFAGPIERGDKEARSRLKRLVQPFILRRLKSQVLDELPPRTEIQLDVELSEPERAFYEGLRRKIVAELDHGQARGRGDRHLQVLAALMQLRRACCHGSLVAPELDLPSSKLALFGELMDDLLDNHHKALVFSQFVDHLARIRQYLDERGIPYQYLDGQTPAAERQRRVEAFQAGVGAAFLISLRAGGVGLNLTAADYVIHMDPWWNPAVEDQASDRAHRIGQQRPVTVYRLVARGTVEQKIVSLHRHKRDLADSVLAGTEHAGRVDTEELLRLLREA